MLNRSMPAIAGATICQQFPLMTRESDMTVVVDSSFSVSTIGFHLLK
jgi:hypothetical protein